MDTSSICYVKIWTDASLRKRRQSKFSASTNLTETTVMSLESWMSEGEHTKTIYSVSS